MKEEGEEEREDKRGHWVKNGGYSREMLATTVQGGRRMESTGILKETEGGRNSFCQCHD